MCRRHVRLQNSTWPTARLRGLGDCASNSGQHDALERVVLRLLDNGSAGRAVVCSTGRARKRKHAYHDGRAGQGSHGVCHGLHILCCGACVPAGMPHKAVEARDPVAAEPHGAAAPGHVHDRHLLHCCIRGAGVGAGAVHDRAVQRRHVGVSDVLHHDQGLGVRVPGRARAHCAGAVCVSQQG
ncbi:hypothetical protein OPT61_g9191 [Boeremia exigua]|uniref:Uncharacterized protein n=1 Tax=Boeremia exigua TaxID=749465 RepID=A0ACC2HW60_9PLEO|nr:hypothetical protein OPT61_g9191 [Boeremia exigua]